MSESTADSVQSTTQEQVMNFEAGQKYTTVEGNEYAVDFIARESGNTTDLFVVYKRTSPDHDDTEEKYYLKKTTDLKSADDFDEKATDPSTSEESIAEDEELSVSVGQTYKHFKTKDLYIIKAIAYDPKNPGNKFVIYEGQYDSEDFGHNPIWVREYGDFTGMKVFGIGELDGNGQQKAPVKRFELLD